MGASSIPDTRLALEEAGKAIWSDLEGQADLVICFCTSNGKLHNADAVINNAHIIVGSGDSAIPFAANTSCGLQAVGWSKDKKETHACYGEGTSSLVLWALRDPRGTFAVAGSSAESDGPAPKDVGASAARKAVERARTGSRPLGHKDTSRVQTPGHMVMWALSACGEEEHILAGVHESIEKMQKDGRLPEDEVVEEDELRRQHKNKAGCRVLGTTSADGSADDGKDYWWQCDATNSYPQGVVVVLLAPSIDFECVYSHNDGRLDGEKPKGTPKRATVGTGLGNQPGKPGRLITTLTRDGHVGRAAEVYNDWTKEAKLQKAKEEGKGGYVYDEGDTKGQIMEELLTAQEEGRTEGVGILGKSASYPLRVVKKKKKGPAGQSEDVDEDVEPFCVHPSEVTPDGHLRIFAELEEGDTVELVQLSGLELLMQVAVLDGERTDRSMLGSLCFLCAGSQMAIFNDADLADEPDVEGKITITPESGPVKAMQAAFHSATRGMPFALVHPFGEQGSKQPGQAPRHSNLNFGALLFYVPQEKALVSRKTKQRLGDSASEDILKTRAQIAKERDEQSCTFWFVEAECILEATKTLPRFQELHDQGKLQPFKISFKQALESSADPYHALRKESLLAVSHHWKKPGNPDADGQQWLAIKNYLLSEKSKFKYVWYDCERGG